MTQREKQIEETKREISRLQEKLKRLEEFDGSIGLDTLLIDTDFPLNGVRIYLGNMGIKTVEDLLNSSPKKLLKCRGLGPVNLKKVEEWMQKNNLKFS